MALCNYITESHIDTVKTFCETFPEWIKHRKTEVGKNNKDMKLDSLAEVLKEGLGLEKLNCVLKRRQLQVVLYRYTTDTLIYIKNVREFCEKFSKWKITVEEDMTAMSHIKDRADKINLKFSHVTKSEQKGKAFVKYMKSKVPQTADTTAKLEKELSEVLNRTLRFLEKLDCFLDAVEKLAVTSLHVFSENQMLQLPTEIRFEHVQVFIVAARLICPLLLEFKRDAKVFFTPKLQNVEVLKYQLERYIETSQEIYGMFEKSCIRDFDLKMNKEVQLDFKTYLTESDTESMLHHINQLQKIRMDPNFRMVFLFQEVSCSHFISELNKQQPSMLQFLEDLKQCAVQLDRMNKGAKISSVAGSSVGLVGRVLTIVGLVLAPVTAGVSLGLLIGGGTLGILSKTNSVVTTFTEIGVNQTQESKANEAFQKFMENMQSIQFQLTEVISQPTPKIEKSLCIANIKGIVLLVSVAWCTHSFIKEVSDIEVLISRNLTPCAATTTGAEIPKSPTKFKGSLGLSKSARAGAIGLNALFIGMDIFFICKDSISLAKGSETEHSKLIRARASLWKTEMDSWQKICDSLKEGLKTSENKKSVLERPFYPEIN